MNKKSIKNTKPILIISIAICLLFSISCRQDDVETDTSTTDEEVDEVGNVENHDDATDYYWEESEVIHITLNETSISIDGDGATINGSVITINDAGTYNLSGTLSDGQVIVNTAEEAIVRLILDDASINCSNNAAIYVQNAYKAMIVLADSTENTITDGSYYSSTDGANAAIYSEDDLTIFGDGTLTVNGNYNDGITGKDGLIITSGTITVNAVDDGIRGKDYLVITDGDITINTGGDGLKSDNDEDASKGYIEIKTGTFSIASGGDAIAAETDVLITNGEFNLKSGGGSGSNISSDFSAKAIKAGLVLSIADGVIITDAADDAIHSNGDITISGGTFTIASGDDGIHADADVEISAADIRVTESYEGIESALGNITINSGNISIIASDDGINLSAGGTTNSGGRPKSTYTFYIKGGTLIIDCEGDGLDSNGDIEVTGGLVLVNSAEYNENSAIDCDGTCNINGGFVVGVGTSVMSEGASSTSSQYSILIDFSSKNSSGTLIHIENSAGTDILTYKPIKSYQSLAFSSSDLASASTYNVYLGGSSTGTLSNGLYEGGDYTAGSKYTSFTISSITTTIK